MIFTLRQILLLVIALAGAALSTGTGVQGFDFNPGGGVSNRLITPNADGFNDNVVFTFANPRDSRVDGTIFDIKGKEVASMVAGPPANFPNETLLWDGKSNGQPVANGVYIYQLFSEDTVHTGTLVVIK